MSSPKLTEEIELSIRQLILNIVELTIPELPKFESPRYFTSDSDFITFVDNTTQGDLKNYPIQYFMLGFGTWNDSKRKGCEDNPDVFLTYECQLFQRFFQDKDHAKNSHDILVRNSILLRNKFLKNLELAPNKVCRGLEPTGKLVKRQFSPYIDGVFGDWLNFQINIEVTGNGI